VRIAIIFGPYSVSSRPLNFFANNIWIAERGLSGSDLGVVVTAQNLAKMGHDVSLFTFYVPNTKPPVWDGVKLYDYQEIPTIIDDSFDALISWNEPDVFRGVSTNPVRVCQQMLNDFHYCVPGFDDFVDIWTSPSEMHMQWMIKQVPSDKWKAVPLGAEPSWFTKQEKNKGSVVWLSSPDRGLHLLLQQWPTIKKAVPEANLKIFYHINDLRGGDLGNRISYIRYAIPKLKDFGVEYVGSVCRNKITEELSKAMVVVAPLSTVSPTEGFSCSTIEGLTAGCFTVVGDIDCLGSIYSQVACMIPFPVEQHLDQLSNSIVRGLTDTAYREQTVKKCQEFADGYTWTKHAIKLLELITEHPKFKNKNIQIPNINSPVEIKEQIIPTVENIIKLNIGAGPNMFAHDGWINYDREDFNFVINYLRDTKEEDITPHYGYRTLATYLKNGGKVDVRVHDLRQGFAQHADNTVDLIYVGQVIEHLNPVFESPKFLKDCCRMLKPNGVLRMTTPDLDILIDAYKNGEMSKFSSEQPEFYRDADPASQLSYIMFGACGHKCTWDYYEGHFFLYSKVSMTKFLKDAGFSKVFFYDSPGQSLNKIMEKEIIDEGLTHSFIVEAIKEGENINHAFSTEQNEDLAAFQ
jgi:predicted SAM-dependent methyltransferase/glycosyltransferase involved in cell wall biosynthesis